MCLSYLGSFCFEVDLPCEGLLRSRNQKPTRNEARSLSGLVGRLNERTLYYWQINRFFLD